MIQRHNKKYNMNVNYLTGFGNELETEALPGALPKGRNNPRQCEYGLYAEQLSGSAFTAPESKNKRSWLYRLRPSVRHVNRATHAANTHWLTAPGTESAAPHHYRWNPIDLDSDACNWISGMKTMTLSGDAKRLDGIGVHAYSVSESMRDEYFCCDDGELLIIPQHGTLELVTEFGVLFVEPQEIALIPRGVIHRVMVTEPSRGFVCENYGQPFTLPNRGPIGANGMANARDFKAPTAVFEDNDTPTSITRKWAGRFFKSQLNHSPCDVVAWHGNYYPYKYDLRDYSPVGSILFDHPDPSIFTVLTSPSDTEGTANVDFVVFTERWLVGQNTFRPPWYHRNIMSEFMGNIHGVYDAKPGGFPPGAMSLHNMMIPHGPDKNAFERGSNEKDDPTLLSDTMSFMLETRYIQEPTHFALHDAPLQENYADCWSGIEKKFDGKPGRKA